MDRSCDTAVLSARCQMRNFFCATAAAASRASPSVPRSSFIASEYHVFLCNLARKLPLEDVNTQDINMLLYKHASICSSEMFQRRFVSYTQRRQHRDCVSEVFENAALACLLAEMQAHRYLKHVLMCFRLWTHYRNFPTH